MSKSTTFFPSIPSAGETNSLTASVNKTGQIATLCAKRELPQRPSQSPKRQTESPENDVELILDPILFPLEVSSTQCLFYLGDSYLSYGDRIRQFSRADSLRRHVNDVHLRYFESKDRCPHAACDTRLQTVVQFLNHAAVIHKIKLSLDGHKNTPLFLTAGTPDAGPSRNTCLVG